MLAFAGAVATAAASVTVVGRRHSANASGPLLLLPMMAFRCSGKSAGRFVFAAIVQHNALMLHNL